LPSCTYSAYSLDNLSLLALTLAVGFVVDDAIVMLENIVRHIELGETPLQAAIKGSREIGFTIVSMTVSLIAVFIPVMFMSGIVGRLLHEFAVTICVAILVSGIVSLDPDTDAVQPLPEAFRQRGARPNLPRVRALFRIAADRLRKKPALSMAHPRLIILGFVLSVIFSGLLFVQIPKGFLPSGDSGQITATTEGAQDISFAGDGRKAARRSRHRRPGSEHPFFHVLGRRHQLPLRP
jgi:hydrophobic/amphiphilic exporter-1 (mainly G- bacteria), HAE1 family